MQGTEIIDNSDDQNTTDLSKCLSYAKDSMVDIDEGKVSIATFLKSKLSCYKFLLILQSIKHS
jgi:hypothetical protein